MPATTELLQEGRYRIENHHPQNGDGHVYEAYDTVRNTRVVVKEIVVRMNKVTTLSQQETMKLAFANQAKLLTEIKHDSLLHVHDFFSEIGRQYLVMESISGDDLASLLEKNGKGFSYREVAGWADQLLDALNYLHHYSPPILHRNIRPRNVKLAADGRVKLVAFGLADGSNTQISTNFGDDTRDGAALNYSPLEQLWDGLDAASQKVITNSYDDRSERTLKEPADARTDIYSLGATLYHLLTNTQPIDPLERSIDILEGKADPLKAPNKVSSAIPVEISDVVMRAMEIKRENRFDSAVIMRQVIKTALVRIQERDAEEATEQEEAAEAIRLAQQGRSGKPQAVAEPTPVQKAAEPVVAADPPKMTDAEILAEKLREVEEQRLLAEKRAAEAERLLKQKEAELTHISAQPTGTLKMPIQEPEDDLLGLTTMSSISVPESLRNLKIQNETVSRTEVEAPEAQKVEAESEVVAFEERVAETPVETAAEYVANDYHTSESPAHEEPVEEPVIEQAAAEISEAPNVVEAEPVEVAAIEEVAAVEEEAAPFEVKEEPVLVHTPAAEIEVEKSVATDYAASSYADPYEAPVKSSLPIGMPMIAGAAVLVVFLGLGAWLFLGSSGSNDPAPVSSAPTVPAQPSTQDGVSSTSDSNTEPVSSFSDENAPITVESSADPSSQPVKPTGQPTPVKAKTPKPETAKTPAAKKPVTVDDLINDN